MESIDKISENQGISICILQHPQEAKSKLNTANLLQCHYPNVTLKKGLSWRSLKAIYKDQEIDPKKWGVLFLGSKKDLELFDQRTEKYLVLESATKRIKFGEFHWDGIILLDGNWAQSKTLWWRNPWLKKLNRIIFNPSSASLYGKHRKEPRKSALSTLEAAALFFEDVLLDVDKASELREAFKDFLKSQPK